jgi:hypothetical protein
MFGKEKTDKIKTLRTNSSPNKLDRDAEIEQPARGMASSVEHQEISRRTILKGGGALAGLTVLRVAGPARAFPGHASDDDVHDDQPHPAQGLGQPGEEVIPWLDQPPESPFPDNVGNLLKWEELDSWRVPTEDFFLSTITGNQMALVRQRGESESQAWSPDPNP